MMHHTTTAEAPGGPRNKEIPSARPRRCLAAAAFGGLVAAAALGCTRAPGSANGRVPAPGQAVLDEYDVKVGPEYDVFVSAALGGSASGALTVDDAARDYVEDVVAVDGARRRLVARGSDGWTADCVRPCRVEYRFRLRDAATKIADVDTAIAVGSAIVAPPSTWLLGPAALRRGRYRFRVEARAPLGFATGVRPAAGTHDAYEGDLATLGESAYAVFGSLRLVHPTPVLDAAIAAEVPIPDDAIAGWLRSAGSAIGAFLGHPPDDRVLVVVVPGTSEMIRGKTLGGGGASILVRLGTHSGAADLADDWVVAHELVHVGFPALDYEHGWFSEGLATYVEPMARARVGLVPVDEVWRELVVGLPQGLPAKGDRGLEGSEAWGRVYWGGALYFLLADVWIRERTSGARSLDDAIRAVARPGSNVETRWSLERVLDEGDRATGTNVLHELYAKFGRSPERADLDVLWKRLGVRLSGQRVAFDEMAPWAAWRRAITAVQREKEPARENRAQ